MSYVLDARQRIHDPAIWPVAFDRRRENRSRREGALFQNLALGAAVGPLHFRDAEPHRYVCRRVEAANSNFCGVPRVSTHTAGWAAPRHYPIELTLATNVEYDRRRHVYRIALIQCAA